MYLAKKWSRDFYLICTSDTRVSELHAFPSSKSKEVGATSSTVQQSIDVCFTKVAQLMSELLPYVLEVLNEQP